MASVLKLKTRAMLKIKKENFETKLYFFSYKSCKQISLHTTKMKEIQKERNRKGD